MSINPPPIRDPISLKDYLTRTWVQFFNDVQKLVNTINAEYLTKVTGATGKLAQFKADGSLESSTKATTDFAAVVHDHGASHTGLTDDDHTQYALLEGRAGGQTLNGDTASGGDLNLSSTAHATKGDINTDSRILATGDGVLWVDYDMGAASLGAGATAPDLVNLNSTGIYARGFDGNATTEQLFGEIELNHDWVEESDIYFHVHWCPTTAAGGNVKWQLAYALVEDGEVVSSATISKITAAGTTAYEMRTSTFAAISTAGKNIGTQFVFRLFRDPTDGDDTYGADAAVFTIGLHVQVNTAGSRQITVK